MRSYEIYTPNSLQICSSLVFFLGKAYLIGDIKHALFDLLIDLPSCVDEGLQIHNCDFKLILAAYTNSTDISVQAVYFAG